MHSYFGQSQTCTNGYTVEYSFDFESRWSTREFHRRREEAASTPEEAAAARREAQSVSAAQGDLQIAQQDLQNAANQLAQAAATGDPTQIAQAAANLGTASDRTGQAAQGVELATSAARRQKYMKYGAIGGAILLLLGLGYYFVVKGQPSSWNW